MSENGIRINKYLSEAGVCSRREADRLVDAGRVCIDGVTAVSGAKVCDGQTVTLDGRNIKKEEEEFNFVFTNQRESFAQRQRRKTVRK